MVTTSKSSTNTQPMCNYINFVRGKRIVYGCPKISLPRLAAFFTHLYNSSTVPVRREIVPKVADSAYIRSFATNTWKHSYAPKIAWWLHNWDASPSIKRTCTRSKRIRGLPNTRLREVGGGIINKCYAFKFTDWGCRAHDPMHVRKFGWPNIPTRCGGFCSNGMEGMMWVMMKPDNLFTYPTLGEKENKARVILTRNPDESWTETTC